MNCLFHALVNRKKKVGAGGRSYTHPNSFHGKNLMGTWVPLPNSSLWPGEIACNLYLKLIGIANCWGYFCDYPSALAFIRASLPVSLCCMRSGGRMIFSLSGCKGLNM